MIAINSGLCARMIVLEHEGVRGKYVYPSGQSHSHELTHAVAPKLQRRLRREAGV